ncbi:MAG: flavodoxin family protein, partial [Hominimerdicola sp.]
VAEKIGVVAYNIKNEPCEAMNEDLLIIVSGIYSGVIDNQLEQWLKNLDAEQVKCAAIIMSSVSQNYDKAVIKDILTEKGIEIKGEHSCFGSFIFMKFGHPKKDEINEAVKFAREIYDSIN